MKILEMEREEKAPLWRIETHGLPQNTVAPELSSQVSSQSDGRFTAIRLVTNIFIEYPLRAEYICLNIPHSFLSLCIAYTILHTWNIFSFSYLIFIQSLTQVSIFTSSMKSTQTMPVCKHISHPKCAGASPQWLARSNMGIFPQLCFSNLKLQLEISHGGSIYTMKLANATNQEFYSDLWLLK